jgi:ATP-dependent Lon protease
MEVIRLSGYTEDEKMNIAIRYLLPKQMKNTGLKDGELSVSSQRSATSCATTRAKRASGRWSARSPKICRKAVKQLLTEKQEGRRRPESASR